MNSHKKYILYFYILFSFFSLSLLSTPASATVCSDGSISNSQGSGTCSWHGGIAGGNSGSYYNSTGGNSGGAGRIVAPPGTVTFPSQNKSDSLEKPVPFIFSLLGFALGYYVRQDDIAKSKVVNKGSEWGPVAYGFAGLFWGYIFVIFLNYIF